jgi:general secretion pathway protein D
MKSPLVRSLLWPALIALAACAGPNQTLQDADLLLAQGNYEEASRRLDAAAKAGHEDAQTKAAQARGRAQIGERLIREARNATDLDRLDDAERSYRRLLAIDPGQSIAQNELEKLQLRRGRDAQLALAEEQLRGGKTESAERIVRDVLLNMPRHRKALKLAEQIAEQQQKVSSRPSAAAPEFRKLVSLEFKEVTLKSAFDVIWHATGINFILDRDIKTDQKVSLFVRDVSAEEAIESLLMTQQLGRKMVSPKTLFIYPRTPQKLAEYQDLVVRNFFLSHADVKQIQSLLKTVLRIKEIYIDEKRNLLVIRDNQEQVDLANKLIQAHDQAEPEVMLALDVIEIRRTKLNELGLALPGQVSFGVANPLSLAALNNLGSAGINVGFAGPAGINMLGTLNLQKSDSDANMLANPRIRVRNREKAKIHIGDRLPVVTTTSSSTSSFVGETVNYLDVGLKLEVEPQVMLEDHVVVKINLEVSSASQSKINSKFYDIGTRNTNTVLTIRDGETQVLAGLIRDDEREASSRLPGLGDIPILGRLFANERKEQDKTEIILAITPQVINNLSRPSAALTEYAAGTESGSRSGSSTSSLLGSDGGKMNSPAPPSRQESAAPPALTAPAVTSGTSPAPSTPGVGVMPLIEFETPPGVGNSPPAPR